MKAVVLRSGNPRSRTKPRTGLYPRQGYKIICTLLGYGTSIRLILKRLRYVLKGESPVGAILEICGVEKNSEHCLLAV